MSPSTVTLNGMMARLGVGLGILSAALKMHLWTLVILLYDIKVSVDRVSLPTLLRTAVAARCPNKPQYTRTRPVLTSRVGAFARSGGTCQVCGSRVATEAHHWALDYPEHVRYDSCRL